MLTDLAKREEILKLHREGNTYRYIANLLDISIFTVCYWVNRQGSLETRKKSGRRRKTDEATDDEIFLLSQANPFMPTTEIIHRLHLPIKKHSVINRLKEKGLQSYRPAKKEKLTNDHIQKRLEFALRYKYWTAGDWRKVVFSDEKTFSSFGKGINRVWRTKRKNRYDKQYLNIVRKSGRVTVPTWGCISGTIGYHKIHWIRDGRLNGERYVDQILSNYVRPLQNTNLLFMQDNATIHTCKKAMDYIQRQNIKTIVFPKKAPDLNPIENVWAEMERIMATRDLNKQEPLWDAIQDIFEYLENEDYIINLIDSMPRRIAKVIEAEGYWTKY